MSFQNRATRVLVAAAVVLCITPSLYAQDQFEYRVLSTARTSTMQTEMQELASVGFRFGGVMGGETALGGAEVVLVMIRGGNYPGGYRYRLLATSKTSTLQKELQDAGDAGYEYRGQTQFKSAFGGKEVVVILERAREAGPRFEYRLLATSKTSTMQKELTDAGQRGFEFVGVTVGKTALGGDEVVSILRRRVQ